MLFNINFLSRDQAREKLKPILPQYYVHLEDYGPRRNYEYEMDLNNEFGGEWVINEWCPKNGVFCAWRGYVGVETIKKLREDLKRALEGDWDNLHDIRSALWGIEEELKKRC